MKSDIRVCSAWRDEHERPVYTLGDACPRCGARAVNSAPAPFNPEDPYGEYRRRARREPPSASDSDGGAERDPEAERDAGSDPGAESTGS